MLENYIYTSYGRVIQQHSSIPRHRVGDVCDQEVDPGHFAFLL